MWSGHRQLLDMSVREDSIRYVAVDETTRLDISHYSSEGLVSP